MIAADARMRRASPRRRFITFRRDENGSISVEFVLWIPVFITLIAIITDLSIVYVVNANMYDVARDAARRWSQDRSGTEFPDDAAVRTFVTDNLVLGYDRDEVFYEVNPLKDEAANEVTVAIRADSADVDIFGIMRPLGVDNLVAVVTMRLEP
jgi:Flp pilus assembly protein TadG